MLRDDQLPRSLAVDDIEEALALVIGVDVADLDGAGGGSQDVGKAIRRSSVSMKSPLVVRSQ